MTSTISLMFLLMVVLMSWMMCLVATMIMALILMSDIRRMS